MVVQRWHPEDEFRALEDRLLGVLKGFHPREHEELESWTIPLNVLDDPHSITVEGLLPGVKPEDIEVTVDNHVLTIKAHTKSESEAKHGKYLMREVAEGSFYRSLRLPDSVDADKATSAYNHGLLSITFPKLESKKAKQLKINVQAPSKAIEGKKK